MVKIIEGRYYKKRDGNKVGPMKPLIGEEWNWYGIRDDGISDFYRHNGTWDPSPFMESHHDLISEWPSETDQGPIRTITRREIVPGVYGIVRISGSGKSIDVDMEHNGLTVEQAREAAHLFVQIAEFLEDK